MALTATFDSEAEHLRFPALSYSLDGLLAMWDGLENTGFFAEHDSTTNVWKDLVGTRDLTLVSGNANFISNAVAGVSRSSGKIASGAAACTNYKTIEFVCDRPPGTSMMMCAGDGNHIVASTSSKILAQTGGKLYITSPGSSTYAFTYNGSSPTAFFENGEPKTDYSGSDTWSTSGTLWLGAYGNNNYPYVGKIYAVRLYDRVLSDAEIMHHAKIDGERFFGIPYVTETVDFDVRGGGKISVNGREAATSYHAQLDPGVELVLTATPNDGQSFVAWTSDDFELHSPEVITNPLRISPTKSCRLTAVFAPSSSIDEKAVTGYIYDGLVAMWDGIVNAGYGLPHDSTTNVWKDLIGLRNAALIDGNASFEENSLRCSPTVGGGAAAALDRIHDIKTLEVLCDCGTRMIAVDSGASAMLSFIDGRVLGQPSGRKYITSTNLATFASVIAADGCRIYENGRRVTEYSGADYYTQDQTFIIGGGSHYPSSYRYSGRIYAIRAYNRVLTPVEVARNADLDQLRFFDSTIPDSGRNCRVLQDETVQYRVHVECLGKGHVRFPDGSVSDNHDLWVNAGDSITLEALPRTKNVFTVWNSATHNTVTSENAHSNAITVAVNDVVNLTASFEPRTEECLAPTAAGYIRDGLIAQWDGEENVGLGLPHDPDATVWKDLAGDRDLPLTARGSFSENALVCGAGSSYAAGPTNAFSTIRTFEIVCDKCTTSDWNMLFYGGSSSLLLSASGNLFLWGNSRLCYFYYSPTTLSIVDGTYYADGLRADLSGSTDWWGERGTSLTVADSNINGRPYHGRIYSIRVYDRVLTDAERRHNYLIDCRRFFGLVKPSLPGGIIRVR